MKNTLKTDCSEMVEITDPAVLEQIAGGVNWRNVGTVFGTGAVLIGSGIVASGIGVSLPLVLVGAGLVYLSNRRR